MSARKKRSLQKTSVIDLETLCSDLLTKKHLIQRKTTLKWIVENGKELNTSVWFKFEMAADDREQVATLRCTTPANA